MINNLLNCTTCELSPITIKSDTNKLVSKNP